ncbi:MAG: STAS domain-containing protein [Erysipelotrichaceae bacterium]|nr:STAS domain-containing protein [Erysipelotrichaceae bacterium]
MEITKVKAGHQLKLFIVGRIDAITSTQLSEVIDQEIEGVDTIIMDFLGVDYIASAGLRVLLSTKKRVKELTVVHTSENVREVFEMTGFDQFITLK